MSENKNCSSNVQHPASDTDQVTVLGTNASNKRDHTSVAFCKSRRELAHTAAKGRQDYSVTACKTIPSEFRESHKPEEGDQL